MGSMLKADSERQDLVREPAGKDRAQTAAPGRSRAQALSDRRAATGPVAHPARGPGAGRRGG